MENEHIALNGYAINGNEPLSKSIRNGKIESTNVYSKGMSSPNMQENNEFGKESSLNAANTADLIITPVMKYTGRIRAFVEQDYCTKIGTEANKTGSLSEERNNEEKTIADEKEIHAAETNGSNGYTDSRDEKLTSDWNEGHAGERNNSSKEHFPPFQTLLDTNAERNNLSHRNGNEYGELEGSENRNDMLCDPKTPCVTSVVENIRDANYEHSNEEEDTSLGEKHNNITESVVTLGSKSNNAEKVVGAEPQDDSTLDMVSPDHSVLQTTNDNFAPNSLKAINIDLLPLSDSKVSEGSQYRNAEERVPESDNQVNNTGGSFTLRESQPHNPVPNPENLPEKANKMQKMYIEDGNDERFAPSGSRVEDMDPDTVCGIGCFKPRWLQKWATSTTYLVIFSIIGVLQASYYSYLLGIISTVEKRYAFRGKISGIIMMVDEITPVLLGVLVGYFGGKSHRPRMVAVGMYLSAICCFISVIPYFMYGPDPRLMASIASNSTRIAHCEANVEDDNECDDRPPTTVAVVCFLIGSFVKGFGNLAYYAIGLAYMDDTGKKKNMPIYLAITGTLRILGPALGFVMASAFLKYYEDPTIDPGFGPKDARWVGAWWIGFVIQGVLLCAFTFPMLLFPRRLPKQRQRAFSNTQNFYQESVKERITGMFGAVKRLIRNPIYMWFSAGTVFAIIAGFGYFINLTKYVEIQFRLTASKASIMAGPPGLVAVLVSTLTGGLIVWKWKPGPRQLMALILATEVVACICYLVLMVYSCGNYELPGTSLINEELQLQNECNAACNCTASVFTPVCGPDGISTYFSPCHAGCATSNVVDGTTQYSNCSCVYDEYENFITAESVSNGSCYDVAGCWAKAIGFVATWVCFSLIINSMRAGHTMLLLRSVEPRDKSVALGMFETFTCAFGFIPNPVIYGALVDSACLVWESSCGTTGNCWIYDIDHLRHLLHGAAATFAFASCICYAVVFCLAGRVRDLYEEEDTEE